MKPANFTSKLGGGFQIRLQRGPQTKSITLTPNQPMELTFQTFVGTTNGFR